MIEFARKNNHRKRKYRDVEEDDEIITKIKTKAKTIDFPDDDDDGEDNDDFYLEKEEAKDDVAIPEEEE